MHHVLFLCSGNFYRSRFAEAVFNHHATRRDLPLRAFSRGLATYLVDGEGPISPHTRAALAARRIELHHTGAHPRTLQRADLEQAHRTIALKEAEHRPLMRQLFPAWENRIEYWTIHDIDAASPATALPLLETLVLSLLHQCAGAALPSAGDRTSTGAAISAAK
ncbi:MAG: low molecular weight phosphatase family protein [Verrucomicrobia bacterium]|nr:low molecular weight phosphatase family protein [Verrucomicrobiota bacterium]